MVLKVLVKSEVASLVPIRVVIVVEKEASLLRAEASSFRVSRVAGAELIILAI